MSLNSENNSNMKQNNPVVRIDQDSDENLKALFDSVLNPGDSKRPLQVPFRMRKLPNSFFTPPMSDSKSPSASHSRANSTDSAFEAEIQSNSGNNLSTKPPCFSPAGLQICHSRAHSSPASLQQTQKDQNPPPMTVNLERDPSIKSNGTTNYLKLHQQRQDTSENIRSVHMKQRSFDVISPIQLQNELGVLPPGWEQAKTNDGQIYYLNHATKTTQWEDPRLQYRNQNLYQQTGNNMKFGNKVPDALEENLGPLPRGWEQALTETGDVYFINHIDRTTSWNDPRLPLLQKQAQRSDVSWGEMSQMDKNRDSFKDTQQQHAQKTMIRNLDPFLADENHSRQESGDSGLSLSSNNFSLNTELMSQIDDSMDCISGNGTIGSLTGFDCPDNLVSSLQLEDNICIEMLSNPQSIIDTPSQKIENLDLYKIN